MDTDIPEGIRGVSVTWIVGREARRRVSSVTCPSLVGALKSTRTKTVCERNGNRWGKPSVRQIKRKREIPASRSVREAERGGNFRALQRACHRCRIMPSNMTDGKTNKTTNITEIQLQFQRSLSEHKRQVNCWPNSNARVVGGNGT